MGDRMTSTPPEAKTATATGIAVSNIVAQLIELSVVLGAMYLRSIDKLSEENLVWVLPALIGPAVAKIRGNAPMASIITLIAVAPFLKKALIFRAFLGATVFLSGCGMLGAAADASVPLLKEVAKAAAPQLLKMAQRKGVEIDESGAACFPISEALESAMGENLPVVAIMCVAPEL